VEKGKIKLNFKATISIETCWTGERNLNHAEYRQPLGKQ